LTTTEATKTAWHRNYLVCFDLETTGPDPTTARIVTADIVWLNPVDGVIAAHRSYLADPGVEIPAEATEVHGITTEYARAHGQPAAEVALLVLDDLETAWSKGLPVVAFNACYDLTVEDRELRRHHGRELKVSGPVLDPLVIDRGVDRYRKGSRKLADMCQFYGVSLVNAHNSAADAEAAGRLLVAQVARHRAKLGRRDLGDLWRTQRAWHRAWAENFEGYLRRTKTEAGESQADIDAVHVNPEWPLQPYAESEAAA
jgi:DNA polymerase III subunit epsilon